MWATLSKGKLNILESAYFIWAVFAQHKWKDSLLQVQRFTPAAATTAVHEDVLFPAVAVEVAVQSHLPFLHQSAQKKKSKSLKSTSAFPFYVCNYGFASLTSK